MKLLPIATLAAVLLLSTGCVTKSTHEMVLQELNTTQGELSEAQMTIKKQQEMIAQNEEELRSSQAQVGMTHDELAMLSMKKTQLQQELDDARSELMQSKDQLEKMRQIEAEQQKRNEIYARFVKELQKMIDGGQLTVTIENGRIVINMPNEVLFASASATLGQQGQEAIRKVADVLKEFSDRRFQVEGHTDNMPISSDRFPSNWELSTARALSVVHLMIDEGVAPQNVSAAGFGEFHPRATNDTKEGRALNRRIEIIMLPNLDILSSELPEVTQ